MTSSPLSAKPFTRRDFLTRAGSGAVLAVTAPSLITLLGKDRDALAAAVSQFAAQLDQKTIEKLLEIALSRGGEFAEVYVEHTANSSLSLQEEKIRQANYGIVQGVGIRVLKGAQTGYGYSDDFSFESLKKAAEVAAFIADQPGSKLGAVKVSEKSYPNISPVRTYPDQVTIKAKTDLLYRANSTARAKDNRITQVDASFGDSVSLITIANSEGLLTHDERVNFRLNVSVVAEANGRRETGYHGGGGRLNFDHFEDSFTPEKPLQKPCVRRPPCWTRWTLRQDPMW